MKTLDIVAMIFPLIVMFIRLTWGEKMKLFAYSDGIDVTIIIPFLIYITGIIFLQNDMRGLAYILLILSFSLRPCMYHLFQYIARRYIYKHPLKKRG